MAEPLSVEAPVERVELFEDRAAITRRIALPTAAGRHVLRVDGVSPLVRDGQLVFPGAEVVVEEARVERWRTTRSEADPQLARDLDAKWRAAKEALRRAEDGSRRAEEAASRARAALEAGLAWGPRLLASGDPESAASAVRGLSEALTDARLVAAERAIAVQLLRDEAQLLEGRLVAARAGSPAWTCALVVRVQTPGGVPSFAVRYTVPCALWRPVHRATLKSPGGGEGRVSWELGAMCWNATGEAWKGVSVVCSTARPGGHADPPVLTDDLLAVRSRDREVVVEAREESIQVAREGEAVQASEVPGVDDGGEPRTFTVPHPVDLPSDGRPVHVRLEGWEAPAKVRWMALPERSSQVVLRSTQPNAGTRPLLAGPVTLHRDAGAVGRGRVGFVGPGEPFAVGWGSHDAVRVTRKADQKVDRSRITSFQTWTFTVSLKVANLGDEAVPVEVKERLPVSEIAEVKVSPPTAMPPLDEGPDHDGLCAWRIVVEPGQVRTIELAYTVEAPASVRLPF